MEASESLARLCLRSTGGEISLIRHEDLLVAWSARCPWIQFHDDGNVLVVLDGRLHNLSSSSADQAEGLLERYRARGTGVARELLGDFVLIVLDRAKKTLLVARDPVGVRPWYQATAGRRHAGTSDVATLVALPWVDTTVDEHIAIEYLAAVEESRGETLYRGIRTLRPGETWSSVGGRARTVSHHEWDVAPELDVSWDEAAERCRAVFDEAVGCRLSADQPATSELSGGLDSSTVVGTLVRLGRADLVAARILFDGPRADERFYSDAVIEHWGVPEVSAGPWIPSGQELEDLTHRLRRPCPDANFTMFADLDRALLELGRRDGLTGLGGDDAFVACDVGSRVVSALKLRQTDVLRDLGAAALRHPRQSWSGVLRPTAGYLAAPWRGRRRLPGWVSRRAAAEADLPSLLGRHAPRVTGIDAIDERVSNFTSGYNASILQTRAVVGDWLGRRESHPFLDPRFVRATYGLDPWWPTRGGHYRALHVAAFRDRLPAVVAQRLSKADFSEVFWPQVLDDATLAEVRSGPLATLGWLDGTGFDALVANAKRGTANSAIPLFRCLSLDRWLRAQ
ncbi:MAG: asparagine synthase-related protein [Actinomycetota bacterium]|nr:asparagine synthase-related protein [Actinomycetota bacterium]